MSSQQQQQQQQQQQTPERCCDMEECPCATAHVDIPGLLILPDFVTSDEEQALLALKDWESKLGNDSARRRVQHYGRVFDYSRSDVAQEAQEAPAALQAVGDLIVSSVPLLSHLSHLDQITLNEYEPGQGIKAHVDRHSAFEDGIISLSLGSATVMNLREGGSKKRLLKRLWLPRRSLLVLTGYARYAVLHEIEKRSEDAYAGEMHPRARRVSATFRQVRTCPCACLWPRLCDAAHLQDGFAKFLAENTAEETHIDHASTPPDFPEDVWACVAEHLDLCDMKALEEALGVALNVARVRGVHTIAKPHLSVFDHMTQLQCVDLQGSKIKDKTCVALVRRCADTLHTWHMAECQSVSDKTLDALALYGTRLLSVDASGCTRITQDGVVRVVEARGHTLHSLYIGHVKTVDDTTLYTIAQHCSALRRLDLRGNEEVGDDGVCGVLQAIPGQLTWLSVRGCRKLSAHTWASLMGNAGSALSHLDVEECLGMGNDAQLIVTQVSTQTHTGPLLRHLNLKRTRGIANTLPSMSWLSWTALRELNLCVTDTDVDTLAHLLHHIDHATVLDVSFTPAALLMTDSLTATLEACVDHPIA